MKKLTAFLITSAMLISMASCGKKDSDTSKKSSSEDEVSADSTDQTETKPDDAADPDDPAEPDDPTNSDNKNDNKSDDTDLDFNDFVNDDAPAPALWKATDPETGNELYLMGTIHIVCEDKFSLPDYILDVYNNCDGVAVEYDIRRLEDMSEMQEFLSYFVYTDGSKISDHVSEKAYEAGKSCLKDMGFYTKLLDNYMPGFWLNQIEASAMLSIKNVSQDGVDSKFMEMAANDGKEVVSIETLDIQAGVISGYPDDYAEFCLENVQEDLEDLEGLAESLAELYNLWAAGKIDEMDELSDETDEIPENILASYESYNNIMLYDRNKGMAERAAEFLKNGDNYFFMVGSLHFAGNRGVDDLLQDMGYTVERLY